MSLQEKIEEIRQKPEHVRMRYVWLWTAISMIFVIFIWVFSLVAQKEEKNDGNSVSNELFNDIDEQKEGIKREVKNIGDSLNEVKEQAGNMSENEGFSSQ